MDRTALSLAKLPWLGLSVLALALFLPVAHAPSPTVTFSLPGSLDGNQPFTYMVILTGFQGNFSGSFWLGGYQLCGWAGNLRNSLPLTLSCYTTVPAILYGQQSTMFNVNTTYYQGPVVSIASGFGGAGRAPLRV